VIEKSVGLLGTDLTSAEMLGEGVAKGYGVPVDLLLEQSLLFFDLAGPALSAWLPVLLLL
jgi:hypothetical protein